ncbi:GxGYxYP domain-containing protein [Parapedobacter sp. DT-150]|uniref:GxGYxYP domain-containing protein n=1 Tax=Parapedobacter sp. DT-150 TaxID=3396162 RepID=UPI003F1DF82F
MNLNISKYLLLMLVCGTLFGACKPIADKNKLYTYTLNGDTTADAYDEAVMVACIQGIMNRDTTQLYLLSDAHERPAYWLDTLSASGRWLESKERTAIATLEELVALAGKRIKGVIIWDPEVPASLNVATTLAGLEDGIVMSPKQADLYLDRWELPVIKDFRGMFTGQETGSKKNDAYRWAIREFLETGRCDPHWLCLYEDAYMTREKGDISYVVTRDWPVRNKSFVYDLSPWGDEKPLDDPDQRLGADLETYKLMLEAVLKLTKGEQMTEVAGFFSFPKYSNIPGYESKHDPVPTEWETVYLISPYNCYQNTVAHLCFNQSVHAQAPVRELRQGRPELKDPEAGKTYLCILMADYDSATPLYDFLPKHWNDSARGDIPLAWGINPNLIETYPDIIQYFYNTKSLNDFFTADASAAGYMNPNRIDSAYLPLFIDHNKRFYNRLDMSLSPMVLDWDEPTAAVKDAFTQFSPDGFATIVIDMHNNGGKAPEPHVWMDMPVMELLNNACNFSTPPQTARELSAAIPGAADQKPAYYFFRIVWTSPGQVIAALDELKKLRPELDIEVVDPYNFYHLFKSSTKG